MLSSLITRRIEVRNRKNLFNTFITKLFLYRVYYKFWELSNLMSNFALRFVRSVKFPNDDIMSAH